jgi:hypothetical protein
MTAAELGLRRGVLLVVAAAALTAVLGGLVRAAIALPVAPGPHQVALHGPLFVVGVFGTVIALERAVALAARWAYLAPVAGAVAVGLLLAGWSSPAAAAALLSALALVAINVAIVRRQLASFTLLMLAGALLLAAANALWWRGAGVPTVAPAWMAFFVLTIVAERIELSRLAPTPRWASRLVLALGLAVATAAAFSLVSPSPATRLLGAGFLALALWELRFDLARRTVHMPGLPRYSAAGILAGAGWLAVGGWLLALGELPPAGPRYDAALHAVLVGFVLSMVFAHAPIILPAVAQIRLPFHPVLWWPLAILHGGLAVRLAGDLVGSGAWRRAGSLANALALVAFLLAASWARRTGGGRQPRRQPG